MYQELICSDEIVLENEESLCRMSMFHWLNDLSSYFKYEFLLSCYHEEYKILKKLG